MSLSAMSAGSISRSPSFAPVNTDMFTVMGPSPGKDNVSFSFTFLISLTLFPSAVYITMIAYCKCSHFTWLLALSSLGKGKERMYLSVVSKVILRLNTKTSWGPFFLLFILLVMVMRWSSYIYHEVQLFKPICGFQFGRWSASFHMFHTRSKLF